MSNFGDDLIQSLEEAVAHARGEGRGTEHIPARPLGSDTEDSEHAADSEESSGLVEH